MVTKKKKPSNYSLLSFREERNLGSWGRALSGNGLVMGEALWSIPGTHTQPRTAQDGRVT